MSDAQPLAEEEAELDLRARARARASSLTRAREDDDLLSGRISPVEQKVLDLVLEEAEAESAALVAALDQTFEEAIARLEHLDSMEDVQRELTSSIGSESPPPLLTPRSSFSCEGSPQPGSLDGGIQGLYPPILPCVDDLGEPPGELKTDTLSLSLVDASKVEGAVTAALELGEAVGRDDFGAAAQSLSALRNLLRGHEQLSSAIAPTLSVVAGLCEDESFNKMLSSTLRTAGDVVERADVRRATANSLRTAVKLMENEEVKGAIDNALAFASETLEREEVERAVQAAQDFLNSDSVRSASNTTIMLAERVLKSETVDSSIKFATALATDQRLHGYASSVLHSRPVRVGGGVAGSIASSLAHSRAVRGAARASLAVASHPFVASAVRKSANVGLRVVTSPIVTTPIEASFQATLSLINLVSRKLSRPEPGLAQLEAEYDDLKARALVEDEKLMAKLDSLCDDVKVLEAKLAPLNAKISSIEARRSAIARELALKKAQLLRAEMQRDAAQGENGDYVERSADGDVEMYETKDQTDETAPQGTGAPAECTASSSKTISPAQQTAGLATGAAEDQAMA